MMQEMLMEGGNELIDLGGFLIYLFFIRLFQTLNAPLYNSSKTFSYPRYEGALWESKHQPIKGDLLSSPQSEETATIIKLL